MGDIGAAIQEVMEAHEVEINGKTFQGKRRAEGGRGATKNISVQIKNEKKKRKAKKKNELIHE